MAVSIVALLAVLVLVAWRMPGQRVLVAVAVALAVAVLIVGVERAGMWPEGWRTR